VIRWFLVEKCAPRRYTPAENVVTRSKYVGTSFSDFLAEEGLLEGATRVAMDRAAAWRRRSSQKSVKKRRATSARKGIASSKATSG